MWCMEAPGQDMSLLNFVTFLWRLPVERYVLQFIRPNENCRHGAGRSYRMNQVGAGPVDDCHRQINLLHCF